MKQQKASSKIAIAAAMVVLIIIVCNVWEIRAAHQYTITTILPKEKVTQYPLQFSSLTSRQLDILLKVEDPRFFEHHGIDFKTPGAGITTITQGLVKHLYFDKFKPGIAKIKQTLIAYYILDPLMPKEMQIQRLINTVCLGPDVYGFDDAAHYYFHKEFDLLTEDQFIAIVAMIIAPDTFSIKKYPERNRERVARIKKLVNGIYVPKGLFDLYYGKLDRETQEQLPPISYFDHYYN